VPWCATCDRFLSPSTVKVDGTCPSCGRAVDPGHAHVAAAEMPVVAPVVDAVVDTPEGVAEGDVPAEDDEALGPIPWHLKLLAGALALYLGYRAWQGIEWLAHQF
jgi:hypothetical protein